MGERDPVIDLLQALEDPEAAEALAKTLELARRLEESGILDLLLALTGPMVVDRLTQYLVTPGLMKLADRLPELLEALARIAAALEEPVEPVTPSQALARLGDPRVARGLARLLKILEALGEG